jgi:flagellin
MSIPSITNTQTAGVQNAIAGILENSSTLANKIASGEGILFPYEDPAGLAIGTKLEINLEVQKAALKSANQASVVLNIAYGGTKGVVKILKRLDQLSIMALTGSASDSDRKLINLEAQQLKAEINRISTGTEFNGRKLIDGSSANDTTVSVQNDQKLQIINAPSGTIDQRGILDTDGNLVINYKKAAGTTAGAFAINSISVTYAPAAGANPATYKTAAAGFDTNGNAIASGTDITGITATTTGTYIIDGTGKAIYLVDTAGKAVKDVGGTKTYYTFDSDTNVKKVTADTADVITITPTAATTGASAKPATTNILMSGKSYDFEKSDTFVGNPMVFQVGVEADQRISIGFDSVKTKDLNIDGIQLISVESAEAAQKQITDTLEIMFEYNSKIGAYQSRFRMVADSISTAIENVDAARAQFLDADFTQLTKDFSQEQAKLTASIAAEAKLIQTPHMLLQLLQSL